MVVHMEPIQTPHSITDGQGDKRTDNHRIQRAGQCGVRGVCRVVLVRQFNLAATTLSGDIVLVFRNSHSSCRIGCL